MPEKPDHPPASRPLTTEASGPEPPDASASLASAGALGAPPEGDAALYEQEPQGHEASARRMGRRGETAAAAPAGTGRRRRLIALGHRLAKCLWRNVTEIGVIGALLFGALHADMARTRHEAEFRPWLGITETPRRHTSDGGELFQYEYANTGEIPAVRVRSSVTIALRPLAAPPFGEQAEAVYRDLLPDWTVAPVYESAALPGERYRGRKLDPIDRAQLAAASAGDGALVAAVRLQYAAPDGATEGEPAYQTGVLFSLLPVPGDPGQYEWGSVWADVE